MNKKLIFFFPTRFHIFSQLSENPFSEIDYVVYSVYPSIYFSNGNFESIRSKNKTLWLGLFCFALLEIARRASVPISTNNLFKMIYISACEIEFRLRMSFTRNSVVVSAAVYLGKTLRKLRARGNTVVVNHGSLYEGFVRDMMCDLVTAKDGDNWSNQSIIKRMDFEFEYCDQIVLCSPSAYDTMPVQWRSKCSVVPLGAPAWQSPPRAEHSRSDSRGVIFLHVSSLKIIKNLLRIITAFERIRRENDQLLICGPKPFDRCMRELIGRDAKGIKYLGPMPHSRLRKVYQDADIFVHPSLADGWAMVVTEALSVGLPIVSSPWTGSATYYHSRQDGSPPGPIFLVNATSIDSISEGLDTVRSRLERGDPIGTLKPLSWAQSAEILLDVLKPHLQDHLSV